MSQGEAGNEAPTQLLLHATPPFCWELGWGEAGGGWE